MKTLENVNSKLESNNKSKEEDINKSIEDKLKPLMQVYMVNIILLLKLMLIHMGPIIRISEAEEVMETTAVIIQAETTIIMDKEINIRITDKQITLMVRMHRLQHRTINLDHL